MLVQRIKKKVPRKNQRHPKRRLGQHFLTDKSVLQQIGQLLQLRPEQKVLEIGAGTGALTKILVDANVRLTAVEIDNRLVAMLGKRWPKISIIHADILKLDLPELLSGAPWRLVGNLPYNISTQLLARLPDCRQQMQDALFMVQEEVAVRLAASPGNKQWGRLGVWMQTGFHISMLSQIPPEAFWPKPNVNSRLVYLKPRIESDNILNTKLFLWLVKAAFNQRRKRIGNSLKTLQNALPSPVDITQLLADAGLSANSRAEELSVADFVRLANRLQLSSDKDNQP